MVTRVTSGPDPLCEIGRRESEPHWVTLHMVPVAGHDSEARPKEAKARPDEATVAEPGIPCHGTQPSRQRNSSDLGPLYRTLTSSPAAVVQTQVHWKHYSAKPST